MKDQMLKNRKKSNNSAAEFPRLQRQLPETSLHYSIFKHYPSAEMSYTERIATDKFLYSQDMNQLDWEIKEDRKEIHGYQAQKATTSFAGRDYIAWFVRGSKSTFRLSRRERDQKGDKGDKGEILKKTIILQNWNKPT